MKKLMIAAAVAAMIGGVEAYDITYLYDYNATLTTTTGKEGKGVSYTVNLGRDSTANNATWWYEDPIFEPITGDKKQKTRDVTLPSGTYDDVLKAGSKQYPWKLNTSVINKMEDKDLFLEELAYALGFDGKDTKYKYQQKYNKRYVWCETFKYKSPGECYRVKNTQKIKATVFIGDLCSDGYIVEDNGDQWDFTLQFLNRFGGESVAKATSVEALYTFDSDDSGYGNLDNADGTNFGFALAGQGTWKDKLFTYKTQGLTWTFAGVENISGNIVGYLPAPDCEACCASAVKALAFSCSESPTLEDNGWYNLPTAAYGTWSIKFNKNATFKYNGL